MLLQRVCAMLYRRQRFSSQSGKVDAMKSGNTPQAERFQPREELMKEQAVRLGPRERQIVELLVQGCNNAEIAKELKMARRTVKAHFNRLFLRFGITDRIKRVKLANLMYRRQPCQQVNTMKHVYPVHVNNEASSLSPKA